MERNIGRREFMQIGAGVVGGIIAGDALAAEPSPPVTSRPAAVGTVRDLPKRPLGRTGVQVPPLSFGVAVMGHAFYEPEPFEEVINAAIDAGITYFDTARIYDVAEERLKPVLAKRRKEVFLVTKAWSKSKDECLRSLEQSMTLMGVDTVDLAHIHSVGNHTTEQAIGKDGCLAGLQEARKRGWIKHIGCTAHCIPARVIPVLETGEIEVLMVPINFVDYHIYNFEDKVLPLARKHNIGIIAMKVFGGADPELGSYKKKAPGRLRADEDRQATIDYALGQPGLATCVIGLKTLDELRLAIQAVRNHKPLEGKRRKMFMAKGANLAKEWKLHLGPVA